ncbi:hypothetical protein R3P38DRAFT_2793870 [Favolaschia claudopus]|uniref:Uncharacterized protein n=1 Tax=Favolaschia claudopus TaxID=2862362 RepID=A0AAW0AB43_9AGAR
MYKKEEPEKGDIGRKAIEPNPEELPFLPGSEPPPASTGQGKGKATAEQEAEEWAKERKEATNISVILGLSEAIRAADFEALARDAFYRARSQPLLIAQQNDRMWVRFATITEGRQAFRTVYTVERNIRLEYGEDELLAMALSRATDVWRPGVEGNAPAETQAGSRPVRRAQMRSPVTPRPPVIAPVFARLLHHDLDSLIARALARLLGRSPALFRRHATVDTIRAIAPVLVADTVLGSELAPGLVLAPGRVETTAHALAHGLPHPRPQATVPADLPVFHRTGNAEDDPGLVRSRKAIAASCSRRRAPKRTQGVEASLLILTPSEEEEETGDEDEEGEIQQTTPKKKTKRGQRGGSRARRDRKRQKKKREAASVKAALAEQGGEAASTSFSVQREQVAVIPGEDVIWSDDDAMIVEPADGRTEDGDEDARMGLA